MSATQFAEVKKGKVVREIVADAAVDDGEAR